MVVQHYSPYWLYFPAFVVVIVGLVIYFWHSTRTSFSRALVQSNILTWVQRRNKANWTFRRLLTSSGLLLATPSLQMALRNDS